MNKATISSPNSSSFWFVRIIAVPNKSTTLAAREVRKRADPRYSEVDSGTGPQTEKRGSAMTQVCSVYSQLLQLFPRGQFANVVKQHQAEFSAKGFTCWEQFVAMLFCQVAHLNSLREVCLGLAGCESPLKHLGISSAPKKSTLAYAN